MKRAATVILVVVIWIVAALGLTHLWLTHPEVGPILPESWWAWLDSLYGPDNAEEVADMELLTGFVFSSVMLAAFACAAVAGWRVVRRR